MKIPKGITKAFAKAVLKSKKNSPHIFFGLGLAAVGTSTVMACKATLKVEEVLDEVRDNVDRTKNAGPYGSEQEELVAMSKTYAHGGFQLGKLYLPSIVIGGLGVAALTGSHVQLTRRNTALAGSLAATIKGWNEYRARVADEIGKDQELDIYRGVKSEVMVNDDGVEEVVKVRKDGLTPLSPYAKQFDQRSPHWNRNADMNRVFVTLQQDILNHDLRAKGHVFLNEAYKALGIEPTAAGQHVGWVMNGDGDNYIDFGLHEVSTADFATEHGREAWLDFNVDGVITHRLEEY